MLLVIDNYDSFTYNLVHYCQELGAEVAVYRNDALTVSEIADMAPEAVVISPGPCAPEQSGVSLPLVTAQEGKFPILGVCLGHEAIVQAYGGKIVRVAPVHGKTSLICHDGTDVLADVPSPFRAARYHSLAADPGSMPDCLAVTARTTDGVVMAVRHKMHPTFGVQFHPESIASEYGHDVIRNFLAYAKGGRA
jgi:anthranilate synthase component 2